MKLTPLIRALLFLAVLSTAFVGRAQNKETIRQALIRQTYQEAFGRNAKADEVTYWDGRKDWSSKDQLMKFHMEGLKGFPELQDSAVKAAYAAAGLPAPGDAMLNYWKQHLSKYPSPVAALSRDIRGFQDARRRHIDDSYLLAFGKRANEDQIKYWQTRSDWFGKPRNASESLLEMHRNYIRNNDAAAREIVENTYRNVFQRQANPGEFNFWVPHIKGGLLAVEVEASHRDWFNKELKRIVSNPKVMAAINAKGFAIDLNGHLVTLDSVKLTGNTIVAGGGGNIVAGGGGNIVAGGGGNIVAGGGGNVVRPAGTYLIGQDGASLIGQGGSTLIGDGAGTFRVNLNQ